MSQSVKDVLIAARKLIENYDHWTQEEYARDAAGRYANPLDEKAVCFCMIGACARAARVDVRKIEGSGGISEILRNTTGRSAHAFNDEHSHAEVLSAFNRAIAACDGDAA